jgi:hypothetical protein
MACKIHRKNNGEIESVLAPNGKPSKLYAGLVTYLSGNTVEPDAYVQKALGQNLIRDLSPKEHALALWSKIYTPEFKQWFGNSKVVDENGEPIMVYHGTTSKKDFDVFKPGSSTGIFFTDDIQYATDVRSGLRLTNTPYFLRIDNPVNVKEELDNDVVFENRGKGDGIIGKDFGQDLTSTGNTYAVYNPSQIKSVFNQGAFSQEDNIFYQTDSKNSAAVNELDNILLNYIKQFNVKVKDIDDFKSLRNVDALGISDILNKVIYLAKNRNIDTLSEEVGHMLVVLMGDKHPLIEQLMNNIEQWSEYKKIEATYMPIYNSKERVKFEAVGKLLAKHIVQEFNNSKDKGLFQNIIEKVLNWIKETFNTKVPDILSLPAATIASKIIKQDSGLVTYKPRYNYVKLDANKAFQDNPFEKQIHDIVTGSGGKLTGSLAIAPQADIFRSPDEAIHDLDYSFNSLSNIVKVVKELKKLDGIYLHTGISNKDSTSFGIMVPRPGIKIVKYQREKYGWKKGSLNRDSIILYDTNSYKYYKYHESLIVTIDLFLEQNPINYFQEFKRFDDVFAAKQKMNKKSEVFFRREKDQIDYVTLNSFFDPSPKVEYTYYQVQENSIFNQSTFEQDNVYKQIDVQELVDELTDKYATEDGYIIPDYVDHVREKITSVEGVWLKANTKGYYIQTAKSNVIGNREILSTVLNKLRDKFGIQWQWDTTMKEKGRFENGVVYINPNKATLDTAFHEFGHPFILALKSENPALYRRLIKGVKAESKLLERTRKLYPNLTEKELLDEAIVESLGRLASSIETKTYRGVLNRFMDWIRGIIKDLMGQEYTTFKEIATKLSNDTYQKELTERSETVLYQIDPEDVDIYLKQIEGKSGTQKEVAERMISQNRELKLNEITGKYETPDGKKYTRVSDELDKNDYYKYSGPENNEQKQLSLDWGNAVDAILRAVLLNQPVPKTMLDDKISEKLYDEFQGLKKDFPDCILLPQITFLNKRKKVAGTTDVVVIHPDGRLQIVDLKTSKGKFLKGPKVIPNKKHADQYERHDAQLTMYRALAESMGYDMYDKDTLMVLPIELKVNDNVVEEVERPQPYIKHTGVERLYEEYKEGFEKSKFSDIMGNLKTVIQKKINVAKQAGKLSQVHALESILENIRTSIDIQGVNKFIDESYTTFFGNTAFAGYYKIYNDYLDQINADDPLDMLAKIHEIEDMVNTYSASIDELWVSYMNFKELSPLDDFADDSQLAKLDKLRRAFADMKQGFQNKIPRVMAKTLAKQVSPSVVEAIKENIRIKKSQQKSFVEKDTSKMGFFAKQKYNFQKQQANKLAKQLKDLEEQFLNDDGQVDIEEAIYREIRFGGYKDVSMADRWLSPAASMPNSFLAPFVLTIKRAFEEVRLKNLRFIPLAYRQFQEFAKQNKNSIDNPHSFNEGLYTTRVVYNENEDGTVTSKNVLTLVGSLDYSAFNTSFAQMEKRKKEAKTKAEKDKIYNLWKVENKQIRPENHIEGVTKIGDIILIETIGDLEARKKKELGVRGFDAWKQRNTAFDGTLLGEYSIPKISKYQTNDIKNMSSAQLRYYTFLLKTYFESQKNVPPRKESDKLILPYIDKSSNDRIRQGEYWNSLKYKAQDAFMLMEEDILKENTEKTKTIPVLYYDNAHTMEAKDVSTDLIHSILRFKMAADRYAAQNKYVPLADNLLSLVNNTSPAESDAEGFKILDKAAKDAGVVSGVAKYIQKHNGNNTVAMLEAFIDTQLYGIRRVDEKFKVAGVTVDVGKIADTIMNFASVTQIAADPLTSLANSLNAQIQIAEEAFAGQFIDRKSWLEAQKIYNSNELDFIRDSLSPYNKSFLGTLMDTYDAMQGEYLDEFGHKMSKSAIKAKMNTGTLYMGMHKGEHRAAAIMMIALLQKQQRDGKSLFDIHKEQFEKTGSISLDLPLQNKLHAINKRLHGVYNKFDAPELQRHWLGRMMIMYRKFLVPGLKRRFKAEGLDYELGEYTSGMYRDFYKKLFTDIGALKSALLNEEGNLTPYELYNVRRAMFEHMVIATTGIFAWALMNMMPNWDDDDDEMKYIYGAILYQTLRVNAELSVYGGIGDINDYFLWDVKEVITPYKTTSAAFGLLTKVTNLYQAFMQASVATLSGEDIPRYKRDSGVFEKGDSKLFAALLKLMGMSGKNLDTEIALETLMLTKGVDIKAKD